MFDLKELHPVQTAEFAIVQGIDHEPAFNWWVKHVLKKREYMCQHEKGADQIFEEML